MRSFLYKLHCNKSPTCTEVGIETAVCDLGCGETDFRTIPMLGHTEEIVKGYGVTCENSGLTDGVKCSVCGEMLTAHQEIGVLDHKDDDGDYLCDYGCGYEFEKPAEPDTPDEPETPDEPSDTECDHLCHKDGFLGFIWKIINFFNRLFSINQHCDCGKPHYDAPFFG